ncbi:MAG TPA: LamG domain-containing protein, partial [Gammaproteobacteria bacterium]|nr:LamG domain-containing protein [Gammaproteobacteria bacterium]
FGFHEYEDGRSVFKWGVHNTNGDDAECWTGDASALNQWVHIAGTYDGQQAIIYVDGERICSAQMTGPIALTEHPFSSSGFLNNDGAGTESGVTDEIPGRIDDLRIYNRALSPEEIRSVYENPR